METIKSLENLSFNELYDAFGKAFKDYEIQISKEALKGMLKRRGFVPELSFGAFIDDKLVSFTFNGIGDWNGVKTAYDTGTGTIEEFCGQGLATKVFNYSIPSLKNAGIQQYLLEVLQHNDKAVSIYKKIGFEVSREFNYFSQSNDQVKVKSKELDTSYNIKEMDLSDKELMMIFWDFVPSWQNSFDSIQRTVEDFKILGAYVNQELVGYSIFEPNSGDITQLAVRKEHRRNGIASNLLQRMFELNQNDSLKLVNSTIECEEITNFIEAQGIPLRGAQFEMMKQL